MVLKNLDKPTHINSLFLLNQVSVEMPQISAKGFINTVDGLACVSYI